MRWTNRKISDEDEEEEEEEEEGEEEDGEKEEEEEEKLAMPLWSTALKKCCWVLKSEGKKNEKKIPDKKMIYVDESEPEGGRKN